MALSPAETARYFRQAEQSDLPTYLGDNAAPSTLVRQWREKMAENGKYDPRTDAEITLFLGDQGRQTGDVSMESMYPDFKDQYLDLDLARADAQREGMGDASISKGLNIATRGLGASLVGGYGMLGLPGAEKAMEGAEWMMEGAPRLDVRSLSDIYRQNGVSMDALWNYVPGAVGQAIPSILEAVGVFALGASGVGTPVAAAIAGGRAGASEVAKQGVKHAIIKQLRHGVAKKIRKQGDKLRYSANHPSVKGGFARAGQRMSVEDVAAGMWKMRAGTGASAINSLALNGGEVYNSMREAGYDHDDAQLYAWSFGSIAALPDTILPVWVGRSFLKASGQLGASQATRSTALQWMGKQMKNLGSSVPGAGRIAAGANRVKAMGMAIPFEGTTEAFQEAINIIAPLYKEHGSEVLEGTHGVGMPGSSMVPDVLWTHEHRERILNAGAIGMVAGAGFSLPSLFKGGTKRPEDDQGGPIDTTSPVPLDSPTGSDAIGDLVAFTQANGSTALGRLISATDAAATIEPVIGLDRTGEVAIPNKFGPPVTVATEAIKESIPADVFKKMAEGPAPAEAAVVEAEASAIPTTEEAIPTTEDVTPTTEEAIPTTEEEEVAEFEKWSLEDLDNLKVFHSEEESYQAHWQDKLYENKRKQLAELLEKGISTAAEVKRATKLLNDMRAALMTGVNVNTNREGMEVISETFKQFADSIAIDQSVVEEYKTTEAAAAKKARGWEIVRNKDGGSPSFDGRTHEYFWDRTGNKGPYSHLKKSKTKPAKSTPTPTPKPTETTEAPAQDVAQLRAEMDAIEARRAKMRRKDKTPPAKGTQARAKYDRLSKKFRAAKKKWEAAKGKPTPPEESDEDADEEGGAGVGVGTPKKPKPGGDFDESYTRSKHAENGNIASNAYKKGKPIHVFNKKILDNLAGLVDDVESRGTSTPPARGWKRKELTFDFPIGERLVKGQKRGLQLIYTVELKTKSDGTYHLVPLMNPKATATEKNTGQLDEDAREAHLERERKSKKPTMLTGSQADVDAGRALMTKQELDEQDAASRAETRARWQSTQARKARRAEKEEEVPEGEVPETDQLKGDPLGVVNALLDRIGAGQARADLNAKVKKTKTKAKQKPDGTATVKPSDKTAPFVVTQAQLGSILDLEPESEGHKAKVEELYNKLEPTKNQINFDDLLDQIYEQFEVLKQAEGVHDARITFIVDELLARMHDEPKSGATAANILDLNLIKITRRNNIIKGPIDFKYDVDENGLPVHTRWVFFRTGGHKGTSGLESKAQKVDVSDFTSATPQGAMRWLLNHSRTKGWFKKATDINQPQALGLLMRYDAWADTTKDKKFYAHRGMYPTSYNSKFFEKSGKPAAFIVVRDAKSNYHVLTQQGNPIDVVGPDGKVVLDPINDLAVPTDKNRIAVTPTKGGKDPGEGAGVAQGKWGRFIGISDEETEAEIRRALERSSNGGTGTGMNLTSKIGNRAQTRAAIVLQGPDGKIYMTGLSDMTSGGHKITSKGKAVNGLGVQWFRAGDKIGPSKGNKSSMALLQDVIDEGYKPLRVIRLGKIGGILATKHKPNAQMDALIPGWLDLQTWESTDEGQAWHKHLEWFDGVVDTTGKMRSSGRRGPIVSYGKWDRLVNALLQGNVALELDGAKKSGSLGAWLNLVRASFLPEDSDHLSNLVPFKAAGAENILGAINRIFGRESTGITWSDLYSVMDDPYAEEALKDIYDEAHIGPADDRPVFEGSESAADVAKAIKDFGADETVAKAMQRQWFMAQVDQVMTGALQAEDATIPVEPGLAADVFAYADKQSSKAFLNLEYNQVNFFEEGAWSSNLKSLYAAVSAKLKSPDKEFKERISETEEHTSAEDVKTREKWVHLGDRLAKTGMDLQIFKREMNGVHKFLHREGGRYQNASKVIQQVLEDVENPGVGGYLTLLHESLHFLLDGLPPLERRAILDAVANVIETIGDKYLRERNSRLRQYAKDRPEQASRILKQVKDVEEQLVEMLSQRLKDVNIDKGFIQALLRKIKEIYLRILNGLLYAVSPNILPDLRSDLAIRWLELRMKQWVADDNSVLPPFLQWVNGPTMTTGQRLAEVTNLSGSDPNNIPDYHSRFHGRVIHPSVAPFSPDAIDVNRYNAANITATVSPTYTPQGVNNELWASSELQGELTTEMVASFTNNPELVGMTRDAGQVGIPPMKLVVLSNNEMHTRFPNQVSVWHAGTMFIAKDFVRGKVHAANNETEAAISIEEQKALLAELTAHEYAHHISESMFEEVKRAKYTGTRTKLTKIAEQTTRDWIRLYDHVKAEYEGKPGADAYALTSVEEFIAGARTNQHFIRVLKSMPMPTALAKHFGTKGRLWDALSLTFGRAAAPKSSVHSAIGSLFGKTMEIGASIQESYKPVNGSALLNGMTPADRLNYLKPWQAARAAADSVGTVGHGKARVEAYKINIDEMVDLGDGNPVPAHYVQTGSEEVKWNDDVLLPDTKYLLAYPRSKDNKTPLLSRAYHPMQVWTQDKLLPADEYTWRLYRTPSFINWFGGDWRIGARGIADEVKDPNCQYFRDEITNEPRWVSHSSSFRERDIPQLNMATNPDGSRFFEGFGARGVPSFFAPDVGSYGTWNTIEGGGKVESDNYASEIGAGASPSTTTDFGSALGWMMSQNLTGGGYASHQSEAWGNLMRMAVEQYQMVEYFRLLGLSAQTGQNRLGGNGWSAYKDNQRESEPIFFSSYLMRNDPNEAKGTYPLTTRQLGRTGSDEMRAPTNANKENVFARMFYIPGRYAMDTRHVDFSFDDAFSLGHMEDPFLSEHDKRGRTEEQRLKILADLDAKYDRQTQRTKGRRPRDMTDAEKSEVNKTLKELADTKPTSTPTPARYDPKLEHDTEYVEVRYTVTENDVRDAEAGYVSVLEYIVEENKPIGTDSSGMVKKLMTLNNITEDELQAGDTIKMLKDPVMHYQDVAEEGGGFTVLASKNPNGVILVEMADGSIETFRLKREWEDGHLQRVSGSIQRGWVDDKTHYSSVAGGSFGSPDESIALNGVINFESLKGMLEQISREDFQKHATDMEKRVRAVYPQVLERAEAFMFPAGKPGGDFKTVPLYKTHQLSPRDTWASLAVKYGGKDEDGFVKRLKAVNKNIYINPGAWNHDWAYASGDSVSRGGVIYQALRDIPAGTDSKGDGSPAGPGVSTNEYWKTVHINIPETWVDLAKRLNTDLGSLWEANKDAYNLGKGDETWEDRKRGGAARLMKTMASEFPTPHTGRLTPTWGREGKLIRVRLDDREQALAEHTVWALFPGVYNPLVLNIEELPADWSAGAFSQATVAALQSQPPNFTPQETSRYDEMAFNVAAMQNIPGMSIANSMAGLPQPQEGGRGAVNTMIAARRMMPMFGLSAMMLQLEQSGRTRPGSPTKLNQPFRRLKDGDEQTHVLSVTARELADYLDNPHFEVGSIEGDVEAEALAPYKDFEKIFQEDEALTTKGTEYNRPPEGFKVGEPGAATQLMEDLKNNRDLPNLPSGRDPRTLIVWLAHLRATRLRIDISAGGLPKHGLEPSDVKAIGHRTDSLSGNELSYLIQEGYSMGDIRVAMAMTTLSLFDETYGNSITRRQQEEYIVKYKDLDLGGTMEKRAPLKIALVQASKVSGMSVKNIFDLILAADESTVRLLNLTQQMNTAVNSGHQIMPVLPTTTQIEGVTDDPSGQSPFPAQTTAQELLLPTGETVGPFRTPLSGEDSDAGYNFPQSYTEYAEELSGTTTVNTRADKDKTPMSRSGEFFAVRDVIYRLERMPRSKAMDEVLGATLFNLAAGSTAPKNLLRITDEENGTSWAVVSPVGLAKAANQSKQGTNVRFWNDAARWLGLEITKDTTTSYEAIQPWSGQGPMIDFYEGSTAIMDRDGFSASDHDITAENILEGHALMANVPTSFIRNAYRDAGFKVQDASDKLSDISLRDDGGGGITLAEYMSTGGAPVALTLDEVITSGDAEVKDLAEHLFTRWEEGANSNDQNPDKHLINSESFGEAEIGGLWEEVSLDTDAWKAGGNNEPHFIPGILVNYKVPFIREPAADEALEEAHIENEISKLEKEVAYVNKDYKSYYKKISSDDTPSYGGVIVNQAGEVLLRKPRNEYDNYAWTFAKGQPDPNETAQDTAIREVKEETGLDVEIVGELGGGYFRSSNSFTKMFIMAPKAGYFTYEDGSSGDITARKMGSGEHLERILASTTVELQETEAMKWTDPKGATSTFDHIEETTNEQGRQRDTDIIEMLILTPEYQKIRKEAFGETFDPSKKLIHKKGIQPSLKISKLEEEIGVFRGKLTPKPSAEAKQVAKLLSSKAMNGQDANEGESSIPALLVGYTNAAEPKPIILLMLGPDDQMSVHLGEYEDNPFVVANEDSLSPRADTDEYGTFVDLSRYNELPHRNRLIQDDMTAQADQSFEVGEGPVSEVWTPVGVADLSAKQVSTGTYGTELVENEAGDRRVEKTYGDEGRAAAEVMGSLLASYITGGLVPEARFKGTSKKEVYQVFIENLNEFTVTDRTDADGNPAEGLHGVWDGREFELGDRDLPEWFRSDKTKQTELLVQLIADFVINNRDGHAGNFGNGEQGVIGVDKGQAFKYNPVVIERVPFLEKNAKDYLGSPPGERSDRGYIKEDGTVKQGNEETLEDFMLTQFEMSPGANPKTVYPRLHAILSLLKEPVVEGRGVDLIGRALARTQKLFDYLNSPKGVQTLKPYSDGIGLSEEQSKQFARDLAERAEVISGHVRDYMLHYKLIPSVVKDAAGNEVTLVDETLSEAGNPIHDNWDAWVKSYISGIQEFGPSVSESEMSRVNLREVLERREEIFTSSSSRVAGRGNNNQRSVLEVMGINDPDPVLITRDILGPREYKMYMQDIRAASARSVNRGGLDAIDGLVVMNVRDGGGTGSQVAPIMAGNPSNFGGAKSFNAKGFSIDEKDFPNASLSWKDRIDDIATRGGDTSPIGDPETDHIRGVDQQQAAANQIALESMREAWAAAKRKGYDKSFEKFAKTVFGFNPEENLAYIAEHSPAAATALLSDFDGNDAMTDQTLRYAAMLHTKAVNKLAKRRAKKEDQEEEALSDIEEASEDLNALTAGYKDSTEQERLAQKAVRDLIKEHVKGMDGQVDMTFAMGGLYGALREVEGVLKGEDISKTYRDALYDIHDGKVKVFEYIQDMATLGIDYAVAEENEIITAINESSKDNMKALYNNKPLLATLVAFSKEKALQMALLEGRVARDTDEIRGIDDEIKRVSRLSKESISELLKEIKGIRKQVSKVYKVRDAYAKLKSKLHKRSTRVEKLRQELNAMTEAAKTIRPRQDDLHARLGVGYNFNAIPGETYFRMQQTPAGWIRVEEKYSIDATDANRSKIAKAKYWGKAYLDEQAAKGLMDQPFNRTLESMLLGLNKAIVHREYQTIHMNVLDRWLSTLEQRARALGKSGVHVSRMIATWRRIKSNNVNRLGYLAGRWDGAFDKAVSESPLKDKETFKDLVWDTGIFWFENLPELAGDTQVDQLHAEVYRRIERSLKAAGHTPGRGLEPALKDLWNKTEDIASFENDIGNSHGVFVEDPTVQWSNPVTGSKENLMRRRIKYGRITIPRRLKGEMLGLLTKTMFDQGWSDRGLFATVKAASEGAAPDVAFTEMMKIMEPLLGGRTESSFLTPLVMKPGQPIFTAPGRGAMPIPQDVVSAKWEATESFSEFIQELFLEYDADPAELPVFAYKVIQRLRGVYAMAREVAVKVDNEPLNPNGLQPHRMMDARTNTIFPREWIEYDTFTKVEANIHLAKLASVAAFGRDSSTLIGMLKSAQAEQHEDAEVLADIKLDPLYNAATSEKERYKFIEAKLGKAAAQVAVKTKRARDEIDILSRDLIALFTAPGGGFKDIRWVEEGVQMSADLILRQPKSGLWSILSGTQYGERLGFGKIAGRAGASFMYNSAKNIFGSFFGEFLGFNIIRASNEAKVINWVRSQPGQQDLSYRELFSNHGVQGFGSGAIKAMRGLREVMDQSPNALLGKKGAGQSGFTPFNFLTSPFTWLNNVFGTAVTQGLVSAYRHLVSKAVQAIQADPSILANPNHKFTLANLGVSKGWIKGNERALEYLEDAWSERSGESFLGLATRAYQRVEQRSEMFANSDYLQMHQIAMDDVNLEGGIGSTPVQMRSSKALRWASPLLRWATAKTNSFHKSLQTQEGRFTVNSVLKGMAGMAAVTVPIGLAATLLMDEYDEEILGKKGNLRTVRPTNLIPGVGVYNIFSDFSDEGLGILERLARSGNVYGLGMEAIYGMSQWTDPMQGQRSLGIDRILIVSQISNARDALLNIMHSGWYLNYEDGKKLFDVTFGQGPSHLAQTMNNIVGTVHENERRRTKRIDAYNYIRSAGRAAKLPLGRSGIRTSPTPLTARIRQLQLAAYGDDPEEFMSILREAMETAAGMGHSDPIEPIARSWKSRRPLDLFRRSLTDEEQELLFSHMTSRGQENVLDLIRLHEKYLSYLDSTTVAAPVATNIDRLKQMGL